MGEEIDQKLEELTSELAYIGEKLTEISKCLKKMSNWNETDEKKYQEEDEQEE
jgi:prefoldin subunit 5